MVLVFFCGCRKDFIKETEVARIESNFVYLGDEYVEVYIGNTEPVTMGICFSDKDTLPTLDDNVIFITQWSYDGSYLVKLDSIIEGGKYYCRVFIQKENETVFGSVHSFIMKKTPPGWTQKANFPVDKRNAVGFTIGNKGYMGFGADKNENASDFWEYNPTSNRWTKKTGLPGNTIHRVEGKFVAFSIENKGYICIGTSNEFWEYDPGVNNWTRKADFPGEGRKNAVGFSIGNKGYVGTGYAGYIEFKLFKDFWEYDPVLNQWTRIADFAGGLRYSAAGFSIANKGYVGTGYETLYGSLKDDFWEYDPVANRWTQKADLIGSFGTSRVIPIGFSIENKGYIGIMDSKILEYDTELNMWSQKTIFLGEPRLDPAGFAIGNKGYIGTGYYNSIQNLKDFWEFKP